MKEAKRVQYEVHVHGDVQLRNNVRYRDVEEALRPLWEYAGRQSLSAAKKGIHRGEPGIIWDAKNHEIEFCWSIRAGIDFQAIMDEACEGICDLSAKAGVLELRYFLEDSDDEEAERDDEDDEEDDDDDDGSSEFRRIFVGPNPEAINELQRQYLIDRVHHLLNKHFETEETVSVLDAINHLFDTRLAAITKGLDLPSSASPRLGDSSSMTELSSIQQVESHRKRSY